MAKRRTLSQFFEDLGKRLEAFEKYVDERVICSPAMQKVMPVLRPILIYLLFLPMVSVLIPVFRAPFLDHAGTAVETFRNPTLVCFVTETLLVYAILHSLILTFAIYHRLERRPFLTAHPSECNKRTARREILASRNFRTEWLILTAFFLLHPVKWGINAPLFLIPTAAHWHPILQKLFLTAIFAAVTFWLELRARMDARRLWIEMPSRLMRARLWKSMERKKRRRYSLLRMALRLVLHIAIYSVTLPLLPFLLQVVRMLLIALIKLACLPWVLGAIAAIIAWLYLRAIFARMRYVRRLKKTCRQNGFELFDLRHAYASVFVDFSGYTFGVRAHDKTFYCRLLASVKRSNNIHVSPDGTFRRVFAVSLPKMGLLRVYSTRRTDENPNNRDLELFTVSSATDYTFEADGHKILLLNPVAKRVYGVDKNSQLYILDNGMSVGEYKVFAGNAFLRALERDCADR
ncbi:MAG: hypothetical protein IJW29_07005 [Clostridia bacterium]|nr:hypothetical protein [Clostridia bacterium]